MRLPLRRCHRPPTTTRGSRMLRVELRSSDELLVWLVEVSDSSYSGALRRGEYLLTLAVGKRKVARQPTPNQLADWLYELRDGGSVRFDDSDAKTARTPTGPPVRKAVYRIRGTVEPPPGRTSPKPRQ